MERKLTGALFGKDVDRALSAMAYLQGRESISEGSRWENEIMEGRQKEPVKRRGRSRVRNTVTEGKKGKGIHCRKEGPKEDMEKESGAS